jgi:hypothetical protein
MRKITQQACEAFLAGRNARLGNTEVDTDNGITIMWLHGNAIAKRDGGKTFIRTGGYNDNANGMPASVTTKERLNGLPGVRVDTRKRVLHLNGWEWTDHDEWTEVEVTS